MAGWLVPSPLPLWERSQSCLNIVKATNAGEGWENCHCEKIFDFRGSPFFNFDLSGDIGSRLPLAPCGRGGRGEGLMGEGRNFYPCHCEKIFDFRGSPFFNFDLSGDIGSRLPLAPCGRGEG